MSADLPRIEHLPDGSARIHFAAPILFHDQPRVSCVFRPPTADEYLTHRDPATWLTSGDAASPFIDGDIVRAYARLLIVKDGPESHDADMVLKRGSLDIGLLVEEAILGFFRNARKRSKPESAPPPAPA